MPMLVEIQSAALILMVCFASPPNKEMSLAQSPAEQRKVP